MRARVLRWLLDDGGLLALTTLVLYAWVAPAHISAVDNAEMSTLGHIGGVAHPTGYPLYLMWLRATAWIPATSPAHAAALATAVLGAAQIAIIQAACRAWGAQPLAATATAALYAGAPLVLRHNSEAEVFALNGLVVATVLWVTAAHGPARGMARVATLGLVAGLGLSDHVTCVLVAPVGLLGAVRGVREATRPVRTVVLGGVALASGLTPYAYLLVQHDTAVSWGTLDSLHDLMRHFLRMDYGGAGAFSPRGGELDPIRHLTVFARELGRFWLWLPLAAGIVALVARVGRFGGPTETGVSPEPRASWVALLAAFVLAGPLLVARFDAIPAGLNLYALRRFYLMPALLLAPAVALALEHLARRASPRLVGRRGATMLVATLGLAAVAAPSLSYVRRTHSPALQYALAGTLRSLPAGAVLIHSSGAFHYGLGYLRTTEGLRPDVTPVLWPQIGLAWYRARLARAGITLTRPVRELSSVYVADVVLGAGRPLYVDAMQANILSTFPTVPFGIVFHVLPRGTPRPPIQEVVRTNEAVFESFDLQYPRPGRDDDFATAIHDAYAKTWRILTDALVAAGDRDLAARAHAIGAQLAPHDD